MTDPAIAAVLKAEHLSEETRRVYTKNLAMVAEAAGNRALLPVLTRHATSVIQYITTKYTEVASQKTMLVSIMAHSRRGAKATYHHSAKQQALSLMQSCSS